MENEKKSIDYYEQAVRETNDEQARIIFNNIMEQEEYHYNLLQAELDSIMGTGFWFDTAEFRMDGKFWFVVWYHPIIFISFNYNIMQGRNTRVPFVYPHSSFPWVFRIFATKYG